MLTVNYQQNNMRDVTLLFLIKKNGGKVSEMCLAMKKRGFGVGRWNGVGGKLEIGETIPEATRRETFEEIGVKAGELKKVAELTFIFANRPEWNQLVHTYFTEEWAGEPAESEEMSPKWFEADKLPFEAMWPDDPFWLPLAIAGKLIKASFTFGEKDLILEKKVEIVASLAG